MGEEHFEKGCDFVKLTEVSYETFLRYQNDVEDLFQTKKAVKRTATSTLTMMRTQQTSSLEECHFAQHPEEL